MHRPGASFAAAMAAGMLMGGFAESHAASTVHQTQTFSLEATSDVNLPSQDATFLPFDSSLGTLTAVQLTLTDPATGSLATASVTVTGSEGSSQLSASFSISSATAGVDFMGSGNAVPGTPLLLAASDFTPHTQTFAGPDLAYFVSGTPTFTAAITSFVPDPNCVGTISIDCTFTYDSRFIGSLALDYTYDPVQAVPEPASMTLLATAGLGLTGMSRRSRRPRRPRDG